jgi:hypothetical protein
LLIARKLEILNGIGYLDSNNTAEKCLRQGYVGIGVYIIAVSAISIKFARNIKVRYAPDKCFCRISGQIGSRLPDIRRDF